MATDWKLCKSCGKALEEDANFCPRCGLPINTPQLSQPQIAQKSAPSSSPTGDTTQSASVVSTPAAATNVGIESARTCERCGNTLAANAKFCNKCGTPLQDAETKCRSCGNTLAANAKFCNKCGTPSEGASVPARNVSGAGSQDVSLPAQGIATANLPDSSSKLFPYEKAIVEGGELPTRGLTVVGASPPVLKKGEAIHFANEAAVIESTTVSLGYRGGSHGVSIPLPIKIGGSPIRYRVGRTAGHVKKEQRISETSRGVLILTNKRLLLHPAPGHKPISIPLTKILSYQVFPDGLQVYQDGRQKPYGFQIKDRESVAVFGACLGYLTSN